MLHRKRGEGEHHNSIRKGLLYVTATLVLAFFFVLLGATATAVSSTFSDSYGQQQQPTKRALAASSQNRAPYQYPDSLSQYKKILASSTILSTEFQFSTEALRTQLNQFSTHPDFTTLSEQLVALEARQAELEQLRIDVNRLAQALEEAKTVLIEAQSNESYAIDELDAQSSTLLVKSQNYENQNQVTLEAEELLASTRETHVLMQQIYTSSQSSLNSYLTEFEQISNNYSSAQSTVTNAQNDVDVAQSNYDNNLIPDPEFTGDTQQVPGLRADIYSQISSPNPYRADNVYNFCKTITVTQINHQWGGGDIEGCGSEQVMIHYTGYLTVPEATPYGYDFLSLSDDGWYFTLDNMLINDNWVLKGCGGWWSQKFDLVPNHSYALDAWWYEWSGGACSTLYYDNGYNWGVVPAAWYSQTPVTQIPLIKDPALLAILQQKQAQLTEAQSQLATASENYQSAVVEKERLQQANEQALQNSNTATTNFNEAQFAYDTALVALAPLLSELVIAQKKYDSTLETKNTSEQTTQQRTQEVESAQSRYDQKFTTYSDVLFEANATLEILNTTITQLVAPELEPEPIANVLLGNAVQALTDAFDAIANVGADMSPEVREQAEKIVVSAILVTQVATTAAQIASTSSTTTGTGRRNN